MKSGFLLWSGKEHGNASSSKNGFSEMFLFLFVVVVNLGDFFLWVVVVMDGGDDWEGLKLKS